MQLKSIIALYKQFLIFSQCFQVIKSFIYLQAGHIKNINKYLAHIKVNQLLNLFRYNLLHLICMKIPLIPVGMLRNFDQGEYLDVPA